jgi:hypothetical protein
MKVFISDYLSLASVLQFVAKNSAGDVHGGEKEFTPSIIEYVQKLFRNPSPLITETEDIWRLHLNTFCLHR